MLILLVVLLLFGAKRLPEVGSSIGKGIREFKRSITDTQDAIMSSGRSRPICRPASQTRPSSPTPRRASRSGCPSRTGRAGRRESGRSEEKRRREQEDASLSSYFSRPSPARLSRPSRPSASWPTPPAAVPARPACCRTLSRSVDHLGRASECAKIAPDPLLPGGIHRLSPVLIQLLHELGGIRLGMRQRSG